jgi:hypothetical protein
MDRELDLTRFRHGRARPAIQKNRRLPHRAGASAAPDANLTQSEWTPATLDFAGSDAIGDTMRLGRFVILTLCSFAVFALTMTFSPLLPAWGNWAARGGLIILSGGLWLAARGDGPLSAYRPVFFAWLAAVVGLSLGFYLSDPLLARLHLTTNTPAGVTAAKFLQALLIVLGVIVTAKLFGENLGSLYIRKGRLILGLGIGLVGCAVFVGLTFVTGGPFLQAATTAGGASKLLPLVPWVLLFVLSNAFMEELLFRDLADRTL